MLFADLFLFDHDELTVFWDLKACKFCDFLRSNRNGFDAATAFFGPQRFLQQLFFFCVTQVTAFFDQRLFHLVVDFRVDDQVTVCGTARTKVRGFRNAAVHRGFCDVCVFVDNHGRVTSANAVGRFARRICRLNHWLTAGRHRQVTCAHQIVGQRDRWVFNTLEQVAWCAQFRQSFTHNADHFERGLFRAWVRREDHSVFTFDRVDAGYRRCQFWVGGWDQRRDNACWFRDFGQAFDVVLFDNAHGFTAQRVTQNAQDFETFASAASTVTDAGFVNAHLRDANKGLFVAAVPTQCLRQTVNLRLIVVFDFFHRRMSTNDHLVRDSDFFLCDFTSH